MALESSHRQTFSFPHAFRLKRRRLIRPLFDRNRPDVHSVTAGCIRLLFRVVPREESGHDVSLQIGFATGRGIRSAVRRNRIKRCLREAFRLNQHLLTRLFDDDPDNMLTVMVIFRGDVFAASREIPTHLPLAMQRLAEKIQKGSIPR